MDAANGAATAVSSCENLSDHPIKTGFLGILFQASDFSF
jgi:hypothetical protein